ncbi:MAG TPA: hypothetical protein VGO58_07875 [Chitinophagaceae bacterium]|jgi:hypothetical protein|nr:hypothetical protein [Chitinophagaceae bacterium]
MYRKITGYILMALVLLCWQGLYAQTNEYSLLTEVKVSNSEKKTFSEWKSYPTRIISTLSNYMPVKKMELDKYGGRKDRKETATGFYYTKKINGRWYTINPEGNLFINIGMVSVSAGGSDRSKQVLREKYGSKEDWADETAKLLRGNGFNAYGAWTDNGSLLNTLSQDKKPMAYTIMKNFMSDYGKKRGGTYQESGHIGYPDRTLFVFDPQWEIFCDSYAKQLATTKDDQNLYGYFSDNEFPLERLTLDRYLAKKDTTDPGCIAAKQWLKDHKLTAASVTDSIRNEFLGLVAEKYYSTVSRAIKKYDPNHLYLGSRLHSYELKVRQVFEAVGKYVDVIAINYYRQWTPVATDMKNWEQWSGKPFIVTEWYVKGEDSGMPNYSGAGWIVKTQEDRGAFYQHFALGLLESKCCVGFHWFKYQDNDPTDRSVDPSNTDANKGIVSWDYDLYTPLLNKMKELNTQVYQLADFFDKR